MKQRKKPHEVYLPELDAEHDRLLRTSEGLHQALGAGMATGQLQPVIRALMQNVNAHFSNEERLMRTSRYPAFDWHRRSHEGARKRIQAYADRLETGDSGAISELVTFFGAWLRDHTGLYDRMMGAYLRNFERAETRAAS